MMVMDGLARFWTLLNGLASSTVLNFRRKRSKIEKITVKSEFFVKNSGFTIFVLHIKIDGPLFICNGEQNFRYWELI